jgi:hypothetical protein
MKRFALLLASVFTASADAQAAGDGTVKFSGGSLGTGRPRR